MRISVLVTLLLLISGCATQTGFFSGENLLQPMPIPEESWEVYEKKEGNIYTRFWSKNNRSDELQTNVLFGLTSLGVIKNKSIDDEIGQKNCASFESTDADIKIENTYETLTWFSQCTLTSGTKISILHKAITGNDSSYRLRRTWKTEVSQDQLQLWKDYFATVKACDTRSQGENKCPDGFERVH